MAKISNKIHSVKYNFVMNFILTASNFIFPLITFPYVTRILQAANYGKVNFAASVANYFMMVASLGIPTYGIRACAQVRDDKEELSKTFQELLLINTIVTALVVVSYIVCIFTIPRFAQDKILFLINGINIALNMLGVNWLYQGLEQYDYITIRSIAFKAIALVLMFALVHGAEDYILYAAITVFAAVGSNIFNIVRARRIVNFCPVGSLRSLDLRRHLKPIFILFAQSVTISIYTNLDTVMLGFMKNDTAVGLYNVAIKFKGLLVSLVASLGNVLLPRMSYFVKKEMKEKFIEYMLLALNFACLLAIPICIYFFAYSKEIILLFAGSGYLGAIVAMQYTTLAVFPNGISGVLGTQVLTSLSKEKYVLYSVIIGAVSDFILNIVLIPKWDAAGAAFATMIAEYLVMLTQIIFTRNLLKGIVSKLGFFKYLGLGIVAYLPCYFINKFFVDYLFLKLLVTCIIYFGIYLLLLSATRDQIVLRVIRRKH